MQVNNEWRHKTENERLSQWDAKRSETDVWSQWGVSGVSWPFKAPQGGVGGGGGEKLGHNRALVSDI